MLHGQYDTRMVVYKENAITYYKLWHSCKINLFIIHVPKITYCFSMFLFHFMFFSLLFMCCLYNIVGQCSLKYYIWAKKWPLSFHRRIHVVAAYYWYIDIYMGMSSWICSWFCSLVSFQHHIGAFLLREGPVENKTGWNFAR